MGTLNIHHVNWCLTVCLRGFVVVLCVFCDIILGAYLYIVGSTI